MLARPNGRPPFRADHVGSLLRPPELRQAYKDRQARRIDGEYFAQILDRCIRDVVALQEAAGFRVVTDGEFRRGSYWGRFVERIDGFIIRPAAVQIPRRPRARGRLHGDVCCRQAFPFQAAGAR